MEKPPQKIAIAELPIRLGQFLKLANLVQDGVEAKIRVQEGEVLVNGTMEKRRGKKLLAGDIVSVGGNAWIIDEDEGR